MQTFMKIGAREASAGGGLNTRGVGETGQSGRFVANLVNGAVMCIPINNNE